MSQKALVEEEDILNRQIISLNEKIVKLNSDSGVSVEELEKRLNNLELKKDGLETTKGSLQERITFREEQQITLDEILDKFDEEDLEESISTLNHLKTNLGKVESEIEKVNIKLESLYERKDHLDSHKYNEECDVCMENSKSILETKDTVDSQIKDYKDTLQGFEKQKLDFNIKIESLVGYEDEWDKYQDAKDKEDKLDREISQLINKLSTTETEEIRLDTQIAQQQQLIKEYYKNEKQIQKNKEIRNDITGVRTKQSSIKDELKRINSDVLKLNGKVSALQNQKETIEDRIDEVKELEQQSKLFDFYLNALSKDGVSYELIEKSLPMIEGEVNNILAQIVEFGMQLEIDGKNINAYLVYGDQRWSLEMCSGMERFISGLAIRVALINVCNLPRPNFLVIDEGFGTLDSENLQSLFMLFTYLKTQFDFVMVISHIDSMRDVVDGLIEIKKEKGFSQVKF
jgi:DNA repair exonuclease SbcCD ATPase subunit